MADPLFTREKIMNKKALLLMTCLLVPALTNAHQPNPPTLELVWSVDNALAKPESTLYDKTRMRLYVSNINGSASAKDANGYISKISPEGEVINPHWITGLDAPKGLAMSGKSLYVADIDQLVEVNIEKGQIVNRYPAPEAQFLNDVTIDKLGRVYVSDTRANRIYRLKNGRLDLWFEDPSVVSINGLLALPKGLMIAAGDSDAKDPSRQAYLSIISYKKQRISSFTGDEGIGSLDGISSATKGRYFISDFRKGDIFYTSKCDFPILILSPEPGTADLYYDKKSQMLYVPVLNSSRLLAYKVRW